MLSSDEGMAWLRWAMHDRWSTRARLYIYEQGQLSVGMVVGLGDDIGLADKIS